MVIRVVLFESKDVVRCVWDILLTSYLRYGIGGGSEVDRC